MQEVGISNKDLQNFDVELRTEKPAFRTAKSCPNCYSIAVTYRKWKRDYRCNNCFEYFKAPVFKQIKDRRNELSVPPTLRKSANNRANIQHYSTDYP